MMTPYQIENLPLTRKATAGQHADLLRERMPGLHLVDWVDVVEKGPKEPEGHDGTPVFLAEPYANQVLFVAVAVTAKVLTSTTHADLVEQLVKQRRLWQGRSRQAFTPVPCLFCSDGRRRRPGEDEPPRTFQRGHYLGYFRGKGHRFSVGIEHASQNALVDLREGGMLVPQGVDVGEYNAARVALDEADRRFQQAEKLLGPLTIGYGTPDSLVECEDATAKLAAQLKAWRPGGAK